MSEQDVNDIRILIGRFLDGETSLAEEKRLYEYFSAGEVADGLECYAPMFGWYSSLGPKPVDKKVKSAGFRIYRHWCAAAAMLALIFTFGLFTRQYTYCHKYEAYKGSYIVRDGKKITDLRVVGPEAERIEREFDERIRMAELRMQEADQGISEYVNVTLSGNVDLSNPSVRNYIEEFVDI